MTEQVTISLPDELVENIARRVADLLRSQSTAQSPVESPWLDFEAACAYLNFSKDALYKLTAARAIPVRKKANG